MPPKKTAIDLANSKLPPAAGQTIKVRATERGQYGFPTASIIEPGTVFRFAVKDLEPYAATLAASEAITDDARRKARKDLLLARETVTVGGTKYLLPSWIEDAAKPVETDDDAADEPVSQAASDDVL